MSNFTRGKRILVNDTFWFQGFKMHLVAFESHTEKENGAKIFGRTVRLGVKRRTDVSGWPSNVSRHRSSFVPYEEHNSSLLRKDKYVEKDDYQSLEAQVEEILTEFKEEWEREAGEIKRLEELDLELG